jgi:hypothetical protein
MRSWVVCVALVAAVSGCHSTALPGGDGGAPGDLARAGDAGKPCAVLCTMGFTCCDGACVNLRNDIHNCGACGNVCAAPNDYCDGQNCAPPPCSPACTNGQLCCDVNTGGPSRGAMCTDPMNGTCPRGCPLCL